jgi:predicted nucleic acid-binding protein
MKTVFADSFYFFALVNKRDPAHAKAISFLQSYYGQLLTTGWVLTEAADGLSKPNWRAQFEVLHTEVRSNPNISLVACTDQLFEDGIAFYNSRPDKEWSLTDCISFIVMKHEGIREVLTGDHHFEQAGFIALLK